MDVLAQSITHLRWEVVPSERGLYKGHALFVHPLQAGVGTTKETLTRDVCMPAKAPNKRKKMALLSSTRTGRGFYVNVLLGKDAKGGAVSIRGHVLLCWLYKGPKPVVTRKDRETDEDVPVEQVVAHLWHMGVSSKIPCVPHCLQPQHLQWVSRGENGQHGSLSCKRCLLYQDGAPYAHATPPPKRRLR